MEDDIRKRRRKRRSRYTIILLVFMELILVAAGVSIIILMRNENDKEADAISALSQNDTIEYFTEEPASEPPRQYYVAKPEISEQLLTVNEWSRPGKKIKELDYIVIHYLGNPKTTGQENHDYFESLKTLQNVSMSANYVVGLEGEIIHCVPDDEVAYASNRLNSYSISVENCHPDDTGKFTDATYNSLIWLIAYLSEQYDIDREHIIRHYDVTGKDCPRYFVEHEDAWFAFLDDVFALRQRYYEEGQTEPPPPETEDRELSEFLENQAREMENP